MNFSIDLECVKRIALLGVGDMGSRMVTRAYLEQKPKTSKGETDFFTLDRFKGSITPKIASSGQNKRRGDAPATPQVSETQ